MCIISTNEKIQKLRKQYKLTQQELADRLHTSRSTVANWETGRTVPNAEALEKLYIFFEKQPGYLLENDKKREEFLEWTAPDNALIGLHILEGDRLTFKPFTFPKDGEIMLLKDKENPNHLFAALIEQYEDEYFYRFNMEKRMALQDRAEPVGSYVQLVRRKKD